MSDELIKFQQTRIIELERANAGLLAEATKERKARKLVQSKLDETLEKSDSEFGEIDKTVADLTAERDALKAKVDATPGEIATENERLKGELRSRDVRDKFGSLKEQLADGLTLDDIFKLQSFDPATADPAELKPDELMKGWRDAKPGMFRPVASGNEAGSGNGTTQAKKAPLVVADGAGRGARDTASSPIAISATTLSTPGWMSKDKVRAEAFKSGNYTPTDD